MTENRDAQLQALFVQAQQELDGEILTARVMAKTRSLAYRLIAAGTLGALVLIMGAWMLFAIPMLEFAVLISGVLTNTLVDLGEGWLALVFLPVNNIASLLVLAVKAILVFHKKIMGD